MHKIGGVRSRDPWFDNARWLAGSLVVVVHVLSHAMGGSPLANWMHGAFHPARIPLFALLVGYFTPPVPKPHHYSALVRMVVFPLAVVSSLHIALNYAWGIRPLFNSLYAQYTLWFLYGVIVWRLICPLMVRLRHPLLVAIAISVLSGTLGNLGAFHLRTILGFLPLVMLGMTLRRDDGWLRERTRTSTALAVGVIVAWLIGVTITKAIGVYSGGFVGMTAEYQGEGIAANLIGMACRLGLLIALAMVALAVLHLMPRNKIRWITTIGAGGFTIYLLHGLIVRVMREWGWLPTNASVEWWTIPVYTVFAFLLAALLGSEAVRRVARPLVRPKLRWLLLPDEPATNDVGASGWERLTARGRSQRR